MAEIKMMVEKEINKENPKIVALDNKLSLDNVSKIVNSIVDSVFIKRNGRVEFAAEYYEVLLAYFEIGAFYPDLGVLEGGVWLFFDGYIEGKYSSELNKLKDNPYIQYIENAVKQKVQARMKQIENPLFESLLGLVENVSVLAQRYIDGADKIGTADIQKFIENFGTFSQKVNEQSLTDTVIQMHQSELYQEMQQKEAAKAPEKAKKTPANKQPANSKKSN